MEYAAAEFLHHVTISYRERDGRETSYLLIGTVQQLSEHITGSVTNGLKNGIGPITFIPIHPVNVLQIGA